MWIEYAKTAKMSQKGSSLLKLIQNNETPVLDLLVRESVQNSLDASNGAEDYVQVDFATGTFTSEELSSHLDGITEKLNNRYGDSRSSYLMIRDTNTIGLSGPLTYDQIQGDNYGNLIKLVYEISNPRETEGAGGSWGLGKTIYYRIGIGLVFYYSRIKKMDGSFESRLAACLVENEKSKDALLDNKSKLQRGIAWWGQKINDNLSCPVTDEDEIQQILSVFDVQPYVGRKTGTTIIIPYVNSDNLLSDTARTDVGEDGTLVEQYYWSKSVHEYLKVALQRWYAPRLDNKLFKHGKFLRASVNCEVIQRQRMEPFFKLIQHLYNCASAGVYVELGSMMPKENVHIPKIALRSIFPDDKSSGYFAFTKINASELEMHPPQNYPSPFAYAQGTEVDGDLNAPIVSYVRKPGMIVAYETMGPWVDNTPKSSKDEFMVGIFVLNTQNTVIDGDNPISLEEYVRRGEKADHTSWYDHHLRTRNPEIIKRIQGHVRKHISNVYKASEEKSGQVQNKGLGRELARIFLPPTGYGKDSFVEIRPVKPGKTPPRKKSSIQVTKSPRYSEGKIIIPFEVDLRKPSKTVQFAFKALTETAGVTADSWEKEDMIGTPFPLRIDQLRILDLILDGKNCNFQDESLSAVQKVLQPYEIEMEKLKTNRFSQSYGISMKFEKMMPKMRLRGEFHCTTTDSLVKMKLELHEELQHEQ